MKILFVGLITFLYWRGMLTLTPLLLIIPIGLYPLMKTGILNLVHARRIGTEIFVTIATIIAVIGREYVAASVLMTIILIAEFIAEVNTERARQSGL